MKRNKHKHFIRACLLACLAVLVLAAFVPAGAAAADAQDDVAYDAGSETFADYFGRVWMDKLIEYATVALGALTGVLVTVYKVRRAHAGLVADSRDMRRAQEDLAADTRRLVEAREGYLAMTEQLQQALASVRDAHLDLQRDMGALREDMHALSQAVGIGFCHSAELVQNGYAREVARVLEVTDDAY